MVLVYGVYILTQMFPDLSSKSLSPLFFFWVLIQSFLSVRLLVFESIADFLILALDILIKWV